MKNLETSPPCEGVGRATGRVAHLGEAGFPIPLNVTVC